MARLNAKPVKNVTLRLFQERLLLETLHSAIYFLLSTGGLVEHLIRSSRDPVCTHHL